MNGNCKFIREGNGSWRLDYVFNPEGYMRYYGPEEHYAFYYIKDHLGNVREVYVNPAPGHKECIQRMQYYPSGLPWEDNFGANAQPYKYGSKEFVEMHSLDEYDSEARWYYPALMCTTTMDPLCEKYYSTSPYAWCNNNPVNFVDPDGKWSVLVQGASNRTKYPYALYQVKDNRGNLIFQTVVKVKGTRRQRNKTSGDTPYGTYKQNKWRSDSKFGKNSFIDQDYTSGEGRGPGTDNRDRMHTHGGGDRTNSEGELIGLKGTKGCFRMADEDLVTLKNITDVLEDAIPSEGMTSLIFIQNENITISNSDFVEFRKDAIIGNGTVMLPEVVVKP